MRFECDVQELEGSGAKVSVGTEKRRGLSVEMIQGLPRDYSAICRGSLKRLQNRLAGIYVWKMCPCKPCQTLSHSFLDLLNSPFFHVFCGNRATQHGRFSYFCLPRLNLLTLQDSWRKQVQLGSLSLHIWTWLFQSCEVTFWYLELCLLVLTTSELSKKSVWRSDSQRSLYFSLLTHTYLLLRQGCLRLYSNLERVADSFSSSLLFVGHILPLRIAFTWILACTSKVKQAASAQGIISISEVHHGFLCVALPAISLQALQCQSFVLHHMQPKKGQQLPSLALAPMCRPHGDWISHYKPASRPCNTW